MSGTVTEQQLQEGLQTQLQTLAEFDNAHIVINDYSLLDSSADVTPICIIANTDNFDNLAAAGNRSSGTVVISATIAVRFVDWKESLDAFRDIRQAILTLFNDTSGARSLGLEAVMVNTVTQGGAVDYITLDEQSQLPVWVTQVIQFNIELF